MCHNVLIIARSREDQQVVADKLSVDYQIFTATDWTDSILLLQKQVINLVICLASDNQALGEVGLSRSAGQSFIDCLITLANK